MPPYIWFMLSYTSIEEIPSNLLAYTTIQKQVPVKPSTDCTSYKTITRYPIILIIVAV